MSNTEGKIEHIRARTPDIHCEKQSFVPGFVSIAFHPSWGLPSDVESVRETARGMLLSRLFREGVKVDLKRDDMHHTVVFKATGPYWGAQISAYTPEMDRIAFVSATQTDDGLTYELDKSYDSNFYKREEYKSFGIVQIATSLLVEYAKGKRLPILNLLGTISQSNEASLKARLHMPNLIEGGYFRHQIDLYGGNYNVTTHIHEKSSMEDIRALIHSQTLVAHT